jgi:NRPS condensation-like uncharacterized protein
MVNMSAYGLAETGGATPDFVADRPMHHIVDVIRFGGRYDFGAMYQALNVLVCRHQMLRTVFKESRGQTLQMVLSKIDAGLPECDLSVLPKEEREEAWRQLVHEQSRRAFDLTGAPLYRVMMIHLSPHEHRLLLTIHHLIADEWCTETIQQEMRQLYESFSSDRKSPLAALPI